MLNQFVLIKCACECLHDVCRQVEGRNLADIFRTLPSKKDYPNYYKVITEPIDLGIIENSIKADKVGVVQ